MVKGMIDDGNIEEAIPLPTVSKETLEKVIEFCTYLKDNTPPEIEKPLRSTNLHDVTTTWYADFVDKDLEPFIYDLLLAANFMDIKPLVELCCAKIGSQIKNKSIPEVRKLFNIVNDFTPEEEAQPIEDFYKWAEEHQNEEESK